MYLSGCHQNNQKMLEGFQLQPHKAGGVEVNWPYSATAISEQGFKRCVDAF